MEIGAWLRSLGLERYEPAFRENEIDWEALPKLSAEDLKDLGVVLGGHRRRLLDAIAALGAAEAPPSPAAAQAAIAGAIGVSPLPNLPPLAREGRVGGEAERRQLTVMFCDLVGSTPLATRFDPEDLREIVGAYHRAVADTVGHFDGFVAKYMGDGVLVYFGYPEAHEDDAERAVRAGLAVIDSVGKLPTPEPLNVRLGIASGLVVVGDLIGTGAAQERGVVGETPNLAARLQALAQPGTLVIAEGSRRQIGGLFEVEDLGPRPLAGFAELQRVWRVVGESGVISRFEALRSEATALVGRSEELDLLLRRWQQAKAGEGRGVLVSGEPGIGKSRLTAALSQAIRADRHTRLRYFCSPYHQDSTLYPFITQLERAAQFSRDDTAQTKLGKLRELLAPGARNGDEIELSAELLSLPNSATDLNLSPQRKREMLFEALLHQLEALARMRPVLMVVEDAHWIDPTSRELLDLTLDRVRRLPVLLIVTFRPEFQHGWAGQPHVTMLALNRLGERDVTALVHGLAGNALLGSEIVGEIVERTDGVPLFVEELTKAVLESDDHGAALAASPSPAVSIPATLHASLIARLDRIGATAKEVAQIGAVLGREFPYELIEVVAQRSQAELRAALVRLAEAGLLFSRGAPPHASYLFKHALVQDAAYGTLLRARRQELHMRVAAALEQHFADLVERQPEILAHHLTAAGETERAVAQWLKAGRHAASRSAHTEAAAYFGRGLAILATLSETSARDQREIELQLARAASLLAVNGMASPVAAEGYARARDLAERRQDANNRVAALWGLWIGSQTRGAFDSARGLSDQLLELTQNQTDDGLRLQAHHAAWTTRLFRGEPVLSHTHSQAGRRLYEPDRHRSHALVYGAHDPGVCARFIAAWTGWMLGYPDQAQASIDDALHLAEQLGHPLSLLLVLVFATVTDQFRREPESGRRHLAAAETLAVEQRLVPFFDARVLRGGILTAQDAGADVVALIREGLADRQKPGANKLGRPYGLGLLSEALARSGDHDAALAAVREALAAAAEIGERWWDAELHRLKGLRLLARGGVDDAQAALRDSLRIAREQQAKSLELRAATSLARLWGEQGRREKARKLLAPVYGWFTEGFDTADLKEAKALLEELAA
jgi:class 3 adenylate cyclase/predicted ATPase